MDALFLCCLLVSSEPKPAPSLKAATITVAVSVLADIVSTYRFIDAGTATELNPLYKPFREHKWPVVASMAVLGTSSAWAWNKYVGRKHPRLAKVGLYLAAVVNIALATHNTIQHHRVINQRRKQR